MTKNIMDTIKYFFPKNDLPPHAPYFSPLQHRW